MAYIQSYSGKVQQFVLFADFACLVLWIISAISGLRFGWDNVTTTGIVWIAVLTLVGGENPRLFNPRARILVSLLLTAGITLLISVFTNGSRHDWHTHGGMQTLIFMFCTGLFIRLWAAKLLRQPGVLLIPFNLDEKFSPLLKELANNPHITVEESQGLLPEFGMLSSTLQSTTLVTDLCLNEENYATMMPLSQHMTIADISTTYEEITGKAAVVKQNGLWKLSSQFSLPSALSDHIKSSMDILFVLLTTPITVPVILISALLIKLTSTGPVFFAQYRLGRYGKLMRIYKLRTMRIDAEAAGKQWAGANDNRVTPIGRFLRMTGIDELPQFINILRGEMSLIGPRPECPEIVDKVEQEIHFYRARLLVLPGLTGWAQLHQGGDATIEDVFNKMLYDLYYIKHRSMMLDFRIFLRTAQMLIHLAKPKPCVHPSPHKIPV